MPKASAAKTADVTAPKEGGATTMHALEYLKKFPPLPDGIYIGLDEERYHADTALGSSNIRDLLKGANMYWFKSWMNPKQKASKKTPSKILGSATHKLLLEGEKAFKALYVRGPYDDTFDGTPAEKSALTKAAKAKLLENQELLSADDYDFVLGVKDVIDSDPELEGCLDNGLSEVSVFWTRSDGIRCKCRFDKLKRGGVGDIKTIANERERELDVACKLDINTYRYDIPAEHYLEGRRRLPALLAKGAVFVGEEPLKASALGKDEPKAEAIMNFLQEVVANKSFGFQLVFIPKTGAPDAWSCVLSPGNPILIEAAVDIDTAFSAYKAAIERHGRGRWLPNRAVEELDISELPMGFGRRKPRR